jgi:hypothetical protein
MSPSIEPLLRWLSPRRTLRPSERALFEEKRLLRHVHGLRAILPILVLVHLGAARSSLRELDAAGADPYALRAVVQLHLSSMLFALATLAAVMVAPRRVQNSRIRAGLVEAMLRYYPLFGAAVASRGPTWGGWYLLAVALASLAVVDAASAILIPGLAAVWLTLASGVSGAGLVPGWGSFLIVGAVVVGLLGSRLAEHGLTQEVRASALEGASRSVMQSQLDAQMRSILENVEEIARLNRQLDAQVQRRSRKLSLALARLAEGATGRRTLTAGTIDGMRLVVDAPLNPAQTLWLADDRVTEGKVVLRVGQASSVGELEAYTDVLREIDALTSARHPVFIRTIHIDVTDDGYLVQALEYVPGMSLDRWIAARGPLPSGAVARIGALLADGLATAHDKSILHRALSTASVLMTPFSPGVRLIGFGARQAKADAAPSRRSPLSDAPSRFVAPEFIQGETVDARSDVYALGLVLYESLAGRPPYAPTTGAGWLRAHVSEAALPLTQLAPTVDRALADVVMTCLSKDRAGRPSARALAAKLEEIAGALSAPSVDALVRSMD